VPGAKRGGIERLAHDLASGLVRRGHRVTVWSHDPKPDVAAYDVRPLPWKRFASTWFGRRVTMGYLGNLLALLPRYRDDDIIIALGDSLLLPILRKPVIRIMCGSALGEALSSSSPIRFASQLGIYLQELLTGLLQPGCVGISNNARSFNPLIRRAIPIGIDLNLFRPDFPAKTETPSILFVGTLRGRKRGQLLLDWFSTTIRSRLPEATLTIVGEIGPEMAGVTYRVGLPDEELAKVYRSAWLYASPSKYEGFGLPYVEAMASGTPVVATRNPGSDEVLDGGRCAVLADDSSFADTVCDLLMTPERRAQLAALGLARAREYSLETTLDRYEALLREMLPMKLAEAARTS
jgi:glycosyltransferase involved in cell wall biosynthesis